MTTCYVLSTIMHITCINNINSHSNPMGEY